MRLRDLPAIGLTGCTLAACGPVDPLGMSTPPVPPPAGPLPAATVPPAPPPSPPLVAAARARVGVTLTYDPAYVGLAYPGGDVPDDRGVCTDVVIRALRTARNLDLQQTVHEDMKANFGKYPGNWGLSGPDRNIDHRRVPNLQCWFDRQGWSLPVTKKAADYQPGDLVTCLVGNRPHIMVVSDRMTAEGVPLAIHNIGRGTREEDRLFAFELTGHYRPPSTP